LHEQILKNRQSFLKKNLFIKWLKKWRKCKKKKNERKKERKFEEKKSGLKLFLSERKSKESEFFFYISSKNRVDLTEKSESSRFHNISKLVFLMSWSLIFCQINLIFWLTWKSEDFDFYDFLLNKKNPASLKQNFFDVKNFSKTFFELSKKKNVKIHIFSLFWQKRSIKNPLKKHIRENDKNPFKSEILRILVKTHIFSLLLQKRSLKNPSKKDISENNKKNHSNPW
jgi:hypothetical protein